MSLPTEQESRNCIVIPVVGSNSCPACGRRTFKADDLALGTTRTALWCGLEVAFCNPRTVPMWTKAKVTHWFSDGSNVRPRGFGENGDDRSRRHQGSAVIKAFTPAHAYYDASVPVSSRPGSDLLRGRSKNDLTSIDYGRLRH
jgi:hypothetical protein